MENLVKAQDNVYSKLQTKLRNFKKTSKSRHTRGYLETQIASISELWADFDDRHNEIVETKEDDDDEFNYFKSNLYDT